VKNCKVGKTSGFSKFCSGTRCAPKKDSTSSQHCVLTKQAN